MLPRRKFRLFRIAGFEVGVDPSWLVIALLVVWSLAAGVFPSLMVGYGAGVYWGMATAATLGLFASVVAHELSHSLVARRFGMQMRGITLFIFGGLAEMDDEPPSPKAEALMALAGPAMSLAIGGAFYLLFEAVSGVWPQPVAGVVGYLGLINVVLAAFNLVPAFPLDGGRVLRAGLWRLHRDLLKATRWAAAVGTGFAWLLIAYGMLRTVQGQLVGGLWWVLIGLFLRSVAVMSYTQLRIKTALRHETLAELVRRDLSGVPAGLSLRRFADEYLYKQADRVYPVIDDDRVWRGCIGIEALKRVPQDRWRQVSVGEMASVCEPDKLMDVGDAADLALKRLGARPDDTLFVAEGEQLVGTISKSDLAHYVKAKLEAEGRAAARP